jgi:hypothetical protein
MFKILIFSVLFSFSFTSVFSQDESNALIEKSQIIDNSINMDDFVYIVFLNEIDLSLHEIIDTGIYDDGIPYTVYRLNDNIIITVSIDENGLHYVIGNVQTNEAMKEMLEYLTGIYTYPIPYLNGDGYVAYFHDIENIYIKDNFSDYLGTFTLYGNYMLVEEVIKQEKIIVQRQWCTSDFFDINTRKFGENWGFITPWNNVEYVEITETEPENKTQKTLPAQYTVRLWKATGDCFSSIAGMPFIYNDPYKWRVLYEANKSKLPKPNNPHLIYPGTVLEIPSLEGETRSGIWVFDE